MPFTMIRGSFRLVGRTPRGDPAGFEPDGDSMQFAPDDPRLLDRLARVDRPYRLTSIGSTQLRFEGIDALELHFQSRHQPRPLADEARDYLTGLLGMNPVPYRPPDNLRVRPPVPHDGVRGYILSRALDVHGRPVAFAYAGEPDGRDGGRVTLRSRLLRKSLNFKSLAGGHSYPLFYDTLVASLRDTLAGASRAARAAGKGLWPEDRTTRGLTVRDEADLELHGVLFPKVFRRLTSYFAGGATSLDGFLPWLERTREQVLDLTTGNFTHLDDVLAVRHRTVRLRREPEALVFVSAKFADPKISPWVAY